MGSRAHQQQMYPQHGSHSNQQHQYQQPPPLQQRDWDHQFRLSIELKSIRMDIPDVTFPALFLRYSHPLFATSPPIATYPPTTITPLTEVFLPNSFCMFDFPMKLSNLHDSLRGTPLAVEVVDISEGWNAEGDGLIVGVAAVHLSEVLNSPAGRIESGGILQVWGGYVPICAYNPQSNSQSAVKKVGYVRVIVSLENRGRVEVPNMGDHVQDHVKQEGFAAALELELWLKAEQEKYSDELRSLEAQLLSQVENEWRQREKLREQELYDREEEYSRLKSQLESKLQAIVTREKRVEGVEVEIARRMDAIQREYAIKMQDAEAVSTRMKDDFCFKIEAEAKRREEMEWTNKILLDEVAAYEKRLKQAEEDLLEFKNRMDNTTHAKLQAEVSQLQAQKSEVDRESDKAMGESKATRNKLLKAYQELARLKNQQTASAQASLEKDQRELEALRMHAVIQQQTTYLQGEKAELQGLWGEFERLKEQELGVGPDKAKGTEKPSQKKGTDKKDSEKDKPKDKDKDKDKDKKKDTKNDREKDQYKSPSKNNEKERAKDKDKDTDKKKSKDKDTKEGKIKKLEQSAKKDKQKEQPEIRKPESPIKDRKGKQKQRWAGDVHSDDEDKLPEEVLAVQRELKRLISERNQLFNTGLYTSEDKVIQVLENAIDATAKKLSKLRTE